MQLKSLRSLELATGSGITGVAGTARAMSWTALLERSKSINRQGIYLVPKGSRNDITEECILKIRKTNTKCLRHEFLVGTRLNDYSLKYGFVSYTYDYAVENGTAYLLLSSIPGESLNKMVRNLKSKREKLLLFYQLFLEVEQLERELPFTHYDIHFSNVHVQKLDHPKVFSYQVQGMETVKLTSSYRLFLLDYGYSHFSGVSDTWIEVDASSVRSGSITAVHDPVYDLYAILGKAQYYLDDFDEDLAELMTDDKFIPYNGDQQQKGMLGRVGKEFIYELSVVPDHAWFHQIFFNAKQSEAGDCKELLRPITSSIKGKDISRDDEPFVKQIGKRLKHLKEQRIKMRKHSRAEVVLAILAFFQKRYRPEKESNRLVFRLGNDPAPRKERSEKKRSDKKRSDGSRKNGWREDRRDHSDSRGRRDHSERRDRQESNGKRELEERSSKSRGRSPERHRDRSSSRDGQKHKPRHSRRIKDFSPEPDHRKFGFSLVSKPKSESDPRKFKSFDVDARLRERDELAVKSRKSKKSSRVKVEFKSS